MEDLKMLGVVLSRDAFSPPLSNYYNDWFGDSEINKYVPRNNLEDIQNVWMNWNFVSFIFHFRGTRKNLFCTLALIISTSRL